MDWARFNVQIGPGPMLVLNLICVDLGPVFRIGPGSMYGLGQVQCTYLARPNAGIEPALCLARPSVILGYI